MSDIKHILDGNDDTHKMTVDGRTVGWIVKWYRRDALNNTGIKMFRANPLGGVPAKNDCPTYRSAEAYLLGCAE